MVDDEKELVTFEIKPELKVPVVRTKEFFIAGDNDLDLFVFMPATKRWDKKAKEQFRDNLAANLYDMWQIYVERDLADMVSTNEKQYRNKLLSRCSVA